VLEFGYASVLILRICFGNIGFGYIGCRNDRIFGKPWMISDVSRDMCLLENQLPFFILEELIKLSKIWCPISLNELTFVFLTHRWSSWVPHDNLEEIKFCEAEHFVAFLRICQQPTEQKQQKKIKGNRYSKHTQCNGSPSSWSQV
jgi:hypothetical protein